MSLLDTLIPELQPWAHQLFDLALRAGVRPTVTSALRTYATQDRLYKNFLAGRSKYPVAPPGTSAHEFGYAFDMVVATPTDQADLGTVWRSWNGVYGGDRDPVHFEYPGFISPTGAQETRGSAPQVPSELGTRRKAEQLADLLLNVLPVPLRGILNTAVIATQLLTILGSDASAALDWLLVHPAEAIDMFYDMLWGLVRAALGF